MRALPKGLARATWAWKGGPAAPSQGWEGKTPGEKGQVPLGWAAPPACSAWRQKCQENPTGPGKEGRKAMPQGLPTVSPAPKPLVLDASSPHLSHERSNLELHRGNTRYSDTFGAHASLKLSLRGFPGKAAGQHRSPLWAVPRAGPEASACCCGKGQHGSLA